MKKVQIGLIVVFFCFIAASGAFASESNFAPGSAVTITGSHPNDTPNAGAMLVDGVSAAANPADSNWVHFYGNTGDKVRTVVADLGSHQYISSLSMSFYQHIDWGVYFPTQVTYYVSKDNISWTQVGQAMNRVPASDARQMTQNFAVGGILSYNRYVKAVINFDVWVYTDELKVNGEAKGVVSQNKGVAITGTDPKDKPNAAAMMVDGLRATSSHTDLNWAYFYGNLGNKNRTVIVNLGATKKISEISMTFLQDTGAGIYFPPKVNYYVSTDNVNWTQVGQIPTSIPGSQPGQLIQTFTKYSVDMYAAYVKVEVSVDVWVYFDELQVKGLDSFNIAFGAPYSVSSGVPTEASYIIYENPNFKYSLTDGVFGSSTNWDDGLWMKYCRGESRSVVIDLKQDCTIKKFSMRFIQDTAAGIWYPRKLTYSVSQNGSDWSELGTVSTAIPLTNTGISTQYFTLEGLNSII